jgi:PAS domain S-box-containing protein
MKNIVLVDSENNFLGKKFIKTENFVKRNIKQHKVEKKDFLDVIKLINTIGYEADILKYNEKTNDFIMCHPNNFSKFASYLIRDYTPTVFITKDLINRGIDEVFPDFKKTFYRDLLNRTEQGEKFKIKLKFYEDKKLLYSFNQSLTKYKDYILILTAPQEEFELNNPQDYSLFDSSQQGMAIIQDQKFVKINQSFQTITNFTQEELKEKNINQLMNRYLKKNEKKEWNDIYNSLLNHEIPYYEHEIENPIEDTYFNSYCICENYNGKPALFLTIIDITESKRSEKRANTLMTETEQVAYVFWDSINYYTWTNQIYDILEIKPGIFSKQDNILASFMNEANREKLDLAEREAYINFSDFRIKSKVDVNSGTKDILIYGKFFTTNTEGVETFIGYVQDITDKIKIDKLEEELDEKEVLLKEVHHRIQNNLQIILSLLKLDTRYNPNNPDEIIDSTQARIRTMSLIHEQIYQSSDLSHVNIKEYLNNQVINLFDFYNVKNINFTINVANTEIGMEYATPIALILNEMILNTIKYAFPNHEEDTEGNIEIDLQKIGNTIRLIYTDDGIGLPENININSSTTLGFTIINDLVKQLEGKFNKLECQGTGYLIEFRMDDKNQVYKRN